MFLFIIVILLSANINNILHFRYYPSFMAFTEVSAVSRPLLDSGLRDTSLDDVFSDEQKAKLNTLIAGTGKISPLQYSTRAFT